MIPLSLAALLSAHGSAAGQPKTGESPLPSVETWRLDNGLDVAYVGVDGSPTVAVQVWYRAGSKDEPKNRRGLARVFQHLLFQGSEHARPGAHGAYLAQVGGTASASGIEDAMAVQNVVPTQYLDLVLKLEADRMRGLEWREEAVETALELAKRDLRRQAADPLKRAVRPFLELAYPNHPYAWEAIGDEEDLGKIDLAQLEKFYDTYYQPNNALVVIVGGVDRATAEAAVKKHFGAIAKAAEPPRPADPNAVSPPTKPKRRELSPGQVGVVVRGFHIPEATDDDIYALQVLSIVLGNGSDAPLHRALVDNKKLALQTGATAIVREQPGLFLTFAAYADPSKGGEVEKGLQAQIDALASKPPSAARMTTARNAILADFIFRIESADGLASQVGMSWILTRNPAQFITDVAELEAVTAADIARVAKTYLAASRSVTVVLPPGAR
jgi:zinc protease